MPGEKATRTGNTPNWRRTYSHHIRKQKGRAMNILEETDRLLRLQNEIEATCKQITAEATSRLVAEINRILQAALDPYKGMAVKPEEAGLSQKTRSLLTIAEAAEEVRMSEGFIKAAIRAKELPVIKMGSHTRLQMADLEQWWLAKRRTS